MKILVIGNGFIGSSIIQRLESEGHEILVFSHRFNVDIKSQQLVGDIFTVGGMTKVISWGPQIIIHTAWITTHGSYMTDFSNYQYAQFTSELASKALQANVEHLIILGTCAEYGPQSTQSCAGRTELNPSNLYAQQKIVALNSARETLLGSETRLSWARVFQPYGPNQDSKRLIPYLVDSLRHGRKIYLSDTASIHDWITTRDIASAISWIIFNETPIEIDVGTTFGYTNIQLLQQLEAMLGGSNQWMRIANQSQVGGGMAVVAKDSPLFVSGWLPSDSLDKGLEWALNI